MKDEILEIFNKWQQENANGFPGVDKLFYFIRRLKRLCLPDLGPLNQYIEWMVEDALLDLKSLGDYKAWKKLDAIIFLLKLLKEHKIF